MDTIVKADICLLRSGDLIRLKNEVDAPWFYVDAVKNGVITLEENTMMFYLNEKKIKINPRRKRYVYVNVSYRYRKGIK